MKKKYGENIEVLFTDTESLMDEVCTDYIYQDIWSMKDEFDLASYPKSSRFIDPTKKNVVLKFKDEPSGQSLSEFVGLKPKMNSYQTLNTPHMAKLGS